MNDRPRRNPAIIWREEDELRDAAMAMLERGEDASGEGVLILLCAGVMHQLNLLGAEIWKRCDGERTVEAIAAELSEVFDAEPYEIAADVRDFIAEMKRLGWLAE
jgi:pyrroloquinoline quinone biosynthesis protein D